MSKLLMFDFDGVVADSLDHFASRFLRGCCRIGIDAIQTREDFLDLFSGNLYAGMSAVGIGPDEIVQILGTVEEGTQAALAEVHLFPRMHQLLETLAEQHILVLISSNVTHILQTYLASRNISSFSDVIGGDQEPSKRLKIIRTQQRYPHHEAYYIGDTAGDIVEGRDAGVTTIAVGWGWHTPERLAQESPDHLVTTPEELLRLLC